MFGVVDAFGAKSISVQTFPKGYSVAQIPASIDAMTLRMTRDGSEIAILNTAGDQSNIDMIPAPAPAATSSPRT